MPSPLDTVLDRLYADDARQRAAGLPSSQRTRNLERETGRWLRLLVLATSARAILEVGSSNGVSTLWLASAAAETGGHVTGTELLPERAAEANANLAEAGLGHVAEIADGDAPHTPRGCPFQAWSVGEALRLERLLVPVPTPRRRLAAAR